MLFGLAGLLAGGALLFLLAVVVLIRASSETSYYAHLCLALIVLGGLFVMAGRSLAGWQLVIAVLLGVSITAAMPFENFGLRLADAVSLRDLGLAYLFHIMMLGLYTVGLRGYARMGSSRNLP